MTLELDINLIYKEMLEKIDENTEGDPYADLERIVENEIHKSFQQLQSDEQ